MAEAEALPRTSRDRRLTSTGMPCPRVLPDHGVPDGCRQSWGERMDKIKVIHDAVGHTLTVWLDDPGKEHVCEETTEEIVLMKDVQGRVIGFEVLHYRPAGAATGLSVETVVRAAP